MKYPMDDSRTYRSESGFALIEVIVAAAVLAIVALAVLSGIDAASSTSAREKARAVAASLAEQDQERLRGMTYEQINEKPNVEQQPPINVDGTTYKIDSDVNLVTDDIGGTPECGDEGTQVTYVHITSTVTTPDTGTIGTKIRPVKVDSLIPPTQKWAEGHGTLGVKVVDRSATNGVRNLSVSAASPGYAPPNETTDANGCAVFKDVPIGTYTITLNSLGYLDRDGDQLSQTTANVVAKKVVFSTMSYDVADGAAINIVTHTPGKTWANAGSTQQPSSRARNVTTMNGAKVGFAKTYTPATPQVSVDRGQAVPLRRELLHLLHRCVPLPVTRQGDQHEQLHAAVPELLQLDRRCEPRCGRVARPRRHDPAGDRPPAAVQYPRRLHAQWRDVQRQQHARLRHAAEAQRLLVRHLRGGQVRALHEARGTRPSSVRAPPATAPATTTGSARSKPRTTPGCPSAPTSSACAITTSTAAWC